ncbi:MAG TPA: protease modulator HflC [Candidatus Saccharimonadales bacterium]|nr:protease modulator HflC [Candidatus Saccharimonadales bacterium]
MKRNLPTLGIGVLLLVIFVLLLFVFQVRKTEVAVVTTFGRPTRNITEPGPYWKWPWPIQSVHKFDNRVHNFEGKFEQVYTPDGYSLLLMVYVGWTIREPDNFFPRFNGSTAKAQESLEGLLRNAYSGVVGKHPFGHFISTDEKELKFVEIEKEMLDRIQNDSRSITNGIEIKFLGIKKMGLPESVTELVFKRMQTERELAETKIRSEGERQAADIRSGADLQTARLLADAEATATRTRSQGDAEAAKSYAIFERSPDLANFLLQLNGLELFLKEKTTLILDQATPPLNLLRATSQSPNTGKTGANASNGTILIPGASSAKTP